MAGWVVGKSDFDENPVVSLDLDLDFGLRLRVYQYMKATVGEEWRIPFIKELMMVKEAKFEVEGFEEEEVTTILEFLTTS